MNVAPSTTGQASAAVAMANNAIDNARRAAASSRNRVRGNNAPNNSTPTRGLGYGDSAKPPPSTVPQTPRIEPIPGTAEFVKNDAPASTSPQSMTSKIARNMGRSSAIEKKIAAQQPPADMDLSHNDNAFHVVATLVTDRLLPKVASNPGATHYALSAEDAEFFEQMLPYAVRRSFVDALRYRLQLIRSGDPVRGSADSPLGRLTMQCQMLGLEREQKNPLFELARSVDTSYPLNMKSQGPVAAASPKHSKSNDINEYANPYERQLQGRERDIAQQEQALQERQLRMQQQQLERQENQLRAQQQQLETMQMEQQNIASSVADSPGSPRVGFPNPMSPRVGWQQPFSPEGGLGLDPRVANNWETATESLARQQIMAEINETKFLMRDSVTPEAVSFWKKHLEELHQRLDSLSYEEEQQRNGGLEDAQLAQNVNTFSKIKKHYGKPNFQSREEYLEKNRRMREEAFGSGGVEGYQPPSEQIIEAKVDIVSTSSPPRSPFSKKTQEELPVCDVVAPSDLPGGYMFEAQLGSKKFLATVPPGGVTKGQRFVSTMRELETIEIPVPLGQWRDDFVECCSDGIFHPLFLNTLFFPCIALGQIMTRNGLDWFGQPNSKLVSELSCTNMSVVLVFCLAMNFSAMFMFRVKWERGVPISWIDYVPVTAFNVVFTLYMINLVKSVRSSIRNKYQIPEDRCLGCEDCMCATFCTACTICQIGRHTADFDTYRGVCCTQTGLPRQVALAPVTFYEDQYQNVDAQSSHVV